MESDSIASSWGRKRLVGGLLIALSVLAIPVAVFVPFSSWLGSLEANSAMAATPAPIDGKRAFRYLEQICEIGPRIAGSEANARQRKMVADHFKAMGATLREQPFSTQHPLTGERVNMVNLIGSWHPEHTSAWSSPPITTLVRTRMRKPIRTGSSCRSWAPTTAPPASLC